jgi:hypothetical protein
MQDRVDYPLHPTLAALYIETGRGSDWARIGRNHPNVSKHKYYDPDYEFPEDLQELLPPKVDRWWEHLGE